MRFFLKSFCPYLDIRGPSGGKRIGFCSALQCIWKIRCGAYIYYSPEKMSAQRVTANSSLSQLWGKNPSLRKEYIDRQMVLLDKINEETEFEYSEVIEKEKTNQMFSNEENREVSSRTKAGTAALPEIFGEWHRRTCQGIWHRAELQHD